MGSNPSHPAVECNPGQVVSMHVPLSPSSIIWEQPTGKRLAAGKVTGLAGLTSHWPRGTQTLVVLHLRAQGLGEGDVHPPTLLVQHGRLYLYIQCNVVRMLDLRSMGRRSTSQLLYCRVQPWTSCLHARGSFTKQ